MRFLFLYVQGFAVRAMLFRNIKKSFGKTSLISHAFSVFVCARLRGSSNAFTQHKKSRSERLLLSVMRFLFCIRTRASRGSVKSHYGKNKTVCKRTTLADRCSFFIRLSRRKAAFFRRCAFSVRLNCNHRIGANVLNIEHSLVIGFAR